MKKPTSGVKSDNKPYDTAFKELAEQDPETLLRLVGALPEGATVTPLPREVTAPALFTDQPYLVTTEGERQVAHVEAQTYYDHGVPARNARYGAILWVNTNLPVHSYVLILSPRSMPDDAPTEMTIEAGGITLTVRYHLIKLWEIDAREALAWKRENLLPFVPLMKGGRDELEQGAQALGQVAEEARKRELALHFLVLGGLRYTRAEILDVIWRYSMVPLHQLKDSDGYKFLMEEAIKDAREEIREEARQAMTEIILDLIGKRFPGLDLKVEVERVSDPEVLKHLYFDLDQIASAEDLRARLNELAAKN